MFLAQLWAHTGVRYVLVTFGITLGVVLLNSAAQYYAIAYTQMDRPEARLMLGEVTQALRLGLEFTSVATLFQLMIPVAFYRFWNSLHPTSALWVLPVLAAIAGLIVAITPFVLYGKNQSYYLYFMYLVMLVVRPLTALIAGYVIAFLSEYSRKSA